MSSPSSAARRFRTLLEGDGPILLPGAFDALSARIIEDAGFPGVYLGGFAAGASGLAVADHSLITMSEILDAAQRITSVVDVPVLADLDDGGGNAVNIRRFVRLAERSGLVGVHIEDIIAGKHFAGHADRYVDIKTFANQIRAAVDARPRRRLRDHRALGHHEHRRDDRAQPCCDRSWRGHDLPAVPASA